MEKAIKEKAQLLSTTAHMEDEHAAFVGCMANPVQTAMEELVNAHSTARDHGNSTDLEEEYKSLNTDQRRIVDRVVTAVCHGTEPIRLIVSGQGGTGKSKVINTLHQSVSKQLTCNGLPVVVAAPTGLAAFNIGGKTIHRLFCLPIEHGKPADYSRLGQD